MRKFGETKPQHSCIKHSAHPKLSTQKFTIVCLQAMGWNRRAPNGRNLVSAITIHYLLNLGDWGIIRGGIWRGPNKISKLDDVKFRFENFHTFAHRIGFVDTMAPSTYSWRRLGTYFIKRKIVRPSGKTDKYNQNYRKYSVPNFHSIPFYISDWMNLEFNLLQREKNDLTSHGVYIYYS